MNDALVSLIRTWVPIGVGSLISWLVTLGIELDAATESGLVVGLTGLIIAGYYTVVRLVEKRLPWVGVLLGSTKQPEYRKTTQ